MLALNGFYSVKKSPLTRHVNGIVTVFNKILGTQDRYQNLSFTSMSTIWPLQPAMNIHTSACHCRNLLMKMLNNKRKKKWYETPQSVPIRQSDFPRPTKKKTEDSLRVRTLNVILYKALSDLLTSHEVNVDVPNYNAEITKVSLASDFSACRVYWKTSWLADQDSKIQQVLDKSAPRMRYLLISQQVLSNVPPLVFVKDKQYAALKEVENLLEIADYGPSKDPEHLQLGGKAAETRLHSLQPMEGSRRPIFGIDHDALHKQIEDYKQRSRDPDSQGTSSAQLTQEQLDTLAAIRKQRLIEKKKRKLKKLTDDDVTPKAFLLARRLQEEEEEEEGQYISEKELEDSQAAQLIVDNNWKH